MFVRVVAVYHHTLLGNSVSYHTLSRALWDKLDGVVLLETGMVCKLRFETEQFVLLSYCQNS